jgi:hypothetical protein
MIRSADDVRQEYSRRLEARRRALGGSERTDAAISGVRLAVVVSAVLLAWLAWDGGPISWRWLSLPALAFAILIVVHERVIRARLRGERAVRYYDDCLARLDHRWVGRGVSGDRFLDEDHIFAADLDLFGRGSLFELLCTARTRAGEDALASWLRRPAGPGEVRARQASVEELRGKLDLREDLALLGDDVRSGVHAEALSAWGAAPPVLSSSAERLGAVALVLLTLAALSVWGLGYSGLSPLLVASGAQTLFAWRLRPRVRRVLADVERSARDLALLSQILERLERETFTTPRLVGLRAALDTAGQPPSRRIAKLRRLVDLLDARRNQIFALPSGVLMWATQFAFALESWRTVSGKAIAVWLEAVGEIEALHSLAHYAHDNPADPFPEIVEGSAGFEAEALGHPLLPEETCVTNDVRLGDGVNVFIVSGSNMSGKSTLLRSLGTNTVLAMAGGPVRARRLRLSPLAVGASIRVNDSLQAGQSRFYAEITRLRKIVDLTEGPIPALFLIDEMLHGTNSHDRRIGAAAIVRGLVERGAIGLITTHDLALAEIRDELAPHAENVHFEDHIENGVMTFDYIMRPGIVRKSNALELMRSVGLKI